MKYTLTDERGNTGQQLTFDQGDDKVISITWLTAAGTPLLLATVSEVVAKIFMGVTTPSLVKKLSLSQITLIGTTPSVTGCNITLSSADTTLLPVSPQLSITLVVTTNGKELNIDIPQALVVTAPLVS